MRPVDIVRRLCPSARPAYVAAFDAGDDKIAAAGITTPKRLAPFLATTFAETGGLVVAEESGNYTAQRMTEVWPSRFPTVASAAPYAHNSEVLFNKVYGGRMGNDQPGDGFRYRGRGLFQTTGKEAYAAWSKKLGIDLVASPDLILSADYALAPALYEWSEGGCNAYADKGDFLSIERIINIGTAKTAKTPVGYVDRCAWLRKVEAVLGDGVVDFKPRGAIAATVSEKPRSAATVVIGGATAIAIAAVPHVAPASVAATPSWVPVALGIAAVVAVVAGVTFLIRHHLAVTKD